MALKEAILPATRKVFNKEYAHKHVGFAWLRISCSFIVIIAHSFWLLDQAHPPMVLGVGLGEIALMAVFAMSGYQVHSSWQNDPSWWRFSARRILRIVPPLAVLVTICVFVVGPIFTNLSLSKYFGSGQTWNYLTNALWLREAQLPGVFTENPHYFSLNPSMWTLPMELMGYGLLLIIGLAVAIRLPKLLLPMLLLGLMLTQGVFDQQVGAWDAGGSILGSPAVFVVKFLILFAVGAVLHAYRHKISFRPRYAVALLGAWLLLHVVFVSESAYAGAPGGSGDGSILRLVTLDKWLMAITIAYGAITLGQHIPKRLERHSQWVYSSYGLYLWGAVLQQAMIAMGVADPWLMVALSAPLGYLASQLSWRFVEKPTMKWRRYLKAKQLQ